MSMSPDEFTKVSKVLAEIASEMDEYLVKVQSTYKFAGPLKDADESWNGLFLMGLAISGLELIPFNSDITPKSYWKTAPRPLGDTDEWPISWMVPVDVFDNVGGL